MKEELQQEGEQPSLLNDELLKTLAGSTTANGKIIREVSEQIRKLPDPTVILKELGVRMGAEEKRSGELGSAVDGVKASLEKLTERLSMPTDAISRLRTDLDRHIQFFETPRKKEVLHTHFLGRALLTLIGSFLVIAALVVLLTLAYGRAGRHAENDIKWRYLKISEDTVMLKYVHYIDQNYRADPDKFEKFVTGEEDRQQQLFEKEQVEMKTRNDIETLKKKR
jgi:hypothetical protein